MYRAPPMSPRRWSLSILVAVFFIYLLSSSRERPWGDAHPVWEVAQRLVHHGEIDIKLRWPEDIPPGRDGKTYGITPIGPVLAQVPGVALAGIAKAAAPEDEVLTLPLACHVGPAALGALACAVFFLLLVDLGRSPRVASVCTAVLAFATTTWVYARYPYSEILQLACFVGTFRATWRTIETPTRREAVWLGVWAGCLLESKYINGLAIVGVGVALLWSLRDGATRRRVLGWAAVAGAPFVVLALVYNDLRWDSPFETGYGPYLGAYFGGSLFDGAWGMLGSPDKSALLYSPPLILAALAAPAAIRAQPRYGLLVGLVALPTLLVCCTYRSWSGDYAWGPRFFVYLVPVALVPLAWFVEAAMAAAASRVRRLVLAAVVAAGIAVQLLGNALYWDHFIRIAIDTKNQWLGSPNRSGAYVAERGRGHCDSCFEDTYPILWTPPFQQIRGHWWLLSSIVAGDDAKAAQADAPWRRYTSLDVDLSQSYPRARVDWWGMLWLKDAPDTWPAGIVLTTVFLAGATGARRGGCGYTAAHRHVRRRPLSRRRSASVCSPARRSSRSGCGRRSA